MDVVRHNNLLMWSDAIMADSSALPNDIFDSIDAPQDIQDTRMKTLGERVITVRNLARITLTFDYRTRLALYYGETTAAPQVIERNGSNIIETAAKMRDQIDARPIYAKR